MKKGSFETYLSALKTRNQILAGLCDILQDQQYMEVLYYDKELHLIQEVLNEARRNAGFTGGYNFAESIKLQGGCRLEYGKFKGEPEKMETFAHKWVKKIPAKGADCTLYEMGTYLCYLAGSEMV